MALRQEHAPRSRDNAPQLWQRRHDMDTVLPVLVVALLAACGDDAVHHLPDGPPGGDGATADVSTVDHDSTILITQSPGGPLNNDPATWGGLLQYQVTGDGSALVAAAGIPKTMVQDPVAVAFQASTHELFVGERHGNNAADGVAGSITRFLYDQATHTFTAHGEITGKALAGVHQVAFSPTTGELFAANVNGPISRFTADGAANGTLPLGAVRGVVVAPDGKRLYASSATNQIIQFDLATGAQLASVTTSGNGQLHFFALRDHDLYVGGFADNAVHRYRIGSDDELAFVQDIAADSPVGVAFSADGLEMFVTGHKTSDLLDRFRYDAASDTWIKTDAIDQGVSLGGVVILPG